MNIHTVAPSITAPPMSVSVVSPDPAMFSCTADGVPRPDITWLRVNNGTETEMPEDSSTQITTTTLNGRLIMSILTFNKTQPFRSGMYVCSVTNLLGSAREMAGLIVNGELKNFLQECILTVWLYRCASTHHSSGELCLHS